MANLLKKQPKAVYIPGVQGVAYKPPYCYSEKRYTSKYQRAKDELEKFLNLDIIKTYPENMLSGITQYRLLTNKIKQLEQNSDIYKTVTVCTDAVQAIPGIPSRTDYFADNGWNGGAISIMDVPVGAYFEVTLPDEPSGIVIGLSDGNTARSYGHASHAVAVRPSGITPIEHGADKGIEHPLGKKIRIVRKSDSVDTYIDGVKISTSSNIIRGKAYADAVLYALTDFVEDPVIGDYKELSGESELFITSEISQTPRGLSEFIIQTDAASFSNSTSFSSGISKLASVANGQCLVTYKIKDTSGCFFLDSFIEGYGLFYAGVSASQHSKGISYSNVALKTAGAASDKEIAQAVGYFSKRTLEARMNRPEVSVAQSIGNFSMPALTSHILSGGVSSAESGFAAKGFASENAYFGGSAPAATRYQLDAWYPYLPDDELDNSEFLFSIDSFSLDSAILFFINEGMQISSNLDLYLIINLEAYESVCVGSGLTLNSVIEMMIRERVAVAGSVTQARKESIQYAVNAISGALSLYEGFGFKQFATAAGKTYAVKDDGLYVLTGGTDNGNPLSASIDFGASDFGVAQSKRLSTVFAGIATDGEVYLRVSGDGGQTQVYRAINRGDEVKATTAKGLVARHWRVKLELMNASYADVDNLEIEIGVSQRRQSRGR